MLSTITSGAVYGIRSCMIQVEVDVSPGLPCFQMVGLPGSAVREARERVKVALKNVGVKIPPMCINVNLSPADLPKSGTMFDLPVAVGIMTALSLIPKEAIEDTLLLGELGLSGELKPVRGVLPIFARLLMRRDACREPWKHSERMGFKSLFWILLKFTLSMPHTPTLKT